MRWTCNLWEPIGLPCSLRNLTFLTKQVISTLQFLESEEGEDQGWKDQEKENCCWREPGWMWTTSSQKKEKREIGHSPGRHDCEWWLYRRPNCCGKGMNVFCSMWCFCEFIATEIKLWSRQDSAVLVQNTGPQKQCTTLLRHEHEHKLINPAIITYCIGLNVGWFWIEEPPFSRLILPTLKTIVYQKTFLKLVNCFLTSLLWSK